MGSDEGLFDLLFGFSFLVVFNSYWPIEIRVVLQKEMCRFVPKCYA